MKTGHDVIRTLFPPMRDVKVALDSVARFLIAYKISVLRGLGVALQSNRSDWMVGRLSRQAGEAHAEGILLEVYFLAGGKKAGGLHLRLKSRHDNVVTGPEMDVHVESVALACEARVIRTAGPAKIGLVDGVSIAAHPLADFGKDTNGIFRNAAIGAWADVEKVVAAIARAGDQVLDHAPRAFPIVVGAMVTPTIA